ncbi:MAG: Uma2 family endonuclease [Acidobacteriota bacterium]
MRHTSTRTLAFPCPDVFVVLGVPKVLRRNYLIWEEGQVPTVVIEVTSASSRVEDLGSKKGLYEQLGVREYFLFDPLGDYLKPQLQGFRLTPDGYMRVLGTELASEVLGLRLVTESDGLRLYDIRTGAKLEKYEETMERLRRERERAQLEQARADEESRRAEVERMRADEEARRAEEQRLRADHAEAEIVRLRAELARLRSELGR